LNTIALLECLFRQVATSDLRVYTYVNSTKGKYEVNNLKKKFDGPKEQCYLKVQYEGDVNITRAVDKTSMKCKLKCSGVHWTKAM